MSSLMTVGVTAGMVALGITPLPPPPPEPPAVVAPAVGLAAASEPLGAIPLAFLNNQLTFCGLICPSIVQLVTTVPLGVAEAPLSFVDALQSGSLLKAIGAAAESVTSPADIATTGIITPDVFIVVPKALGTTLPIVVVQAINVAESVLQPGQLVPAIETARENILAALNQPATFPPSNLPSGASGLFENVAVAAVTIPVAIAFQAGELLLQGAVHTANVAATELANTGNVGEALAAGAAAATAVVGQAGGLVADAVGAAVTNISGSLHPASSPAALTSTAMAPRLVKRPAAPSPTATTANAITAKLNAPRHLKDPEAARPTHTVAPAAQKVKQAVQKATTRHADPSGTTPAGKHRKH
jgi:hypothetical protein